MVVQGGTVVVTGAASGIGRAVAQLLADAGVATLLIDRNANELEATAAGLRAAHPAVEVRAAAADVTDAAAIAGLLDDASIGAVGGLAHCAGVLATGPLLDADPGDVLETIRVNAVGSLVMMQAVGRRLRVGGSGGSMVVVGSNAGDTARIGIGAYGASKAAAHQLAHNLGLELAADQIRVNVVAPGSTDTPMQLATHADPAVAIEGDLVRHRLGIPLGRIASPRDIAEVVVFLLSPRARHVTMQTITVDGGATP